MSSDSSVTVAEGGMKWRRGRGGREGGREGGRKGREGGREGREGGGGEGGSEEGRGGREGRGKTLTIIIVKDGDCSLNWI